MTCSFVNRNKTGSNIPITLLITVPDILSYCIADWGRAPLLFPTKTFPAFLLSICQFEFSPFGQNSGFPPAISVLPSEIRQTAIRETLSNFQPIRLITFPHQINVCKEKTDPPILLDTWQQVLLLGDKKARWHRKNRTRVICHKLGPKSEYSVFVTFVTFCYYWSVWWRDWLCCMMCTGRSNCNLGSAPSFLSQSHIFQSHKYVFIPIVLSRDDNIGQTPQSVQLQLLPWFSRLTAVHYRGLQYRSRKWSSFVVLALLCIALHSSSVH